MPFPNPPTYLGLPLDIPRWAYAGGTIVEPDMTKRELGWTVAPGQTYGEIPPYQWMNWLQFAEGEWINYFNDSINYIKAGGTVPSRVILSQSSPVSKTNGSNISMDTVVYLNTSLTPWSADTFTAPITGYYKIDGIIQFLSNNAPFNVQPYIILYLNGSFSKTLYGTRTYVSSLPNLSDTVIINYYIHLTSGDAVTFFIGVGTSFLYGGTSSDQTNQIAISWNI